MLFYLRLRKNFRGSWCIFLQDCERILGAPIICILPLDCGRISGDASVFLFFKIAKEYQWLLVAFALRLGKNIVG